MTLQQKKTSAGNAQRCVNRNAGDREVKAREKPLKPECAAPIMEAMCIFTAAAEFMVALAEEHTRQPSNMIANVLMDINHSRQGFKSACAAFLLRSMPPEEARKEIEGLRAYEALMLAEKRREMKVTRKRKLPNLAKRSQTQTGSARIEGAERISRTGGIRISKTKPNKYQDTSKSTRSPKRTGSGLRSFSPSKYF
jgi:hypothetical protein